MINGLRLTVSLSLFLLAPGAALAQPGADPVPDGSTVVVVTPPAPIVVGVPPGAAELPPRPMVAAAMPAPQNEAWSNVSHINGAPVPVGERGNYLYKWKTTNISSNPIGWMVGFYGLSLSYAVGDHVAVRGDANLFRPIESDEHGYEIGATLPIYFKRVYQGPFMEPGIMVRDFDSDDGSRAFVGPQVNFGWHWTFDSGLNFAFAVGVARRLESTDPDSESYESPIEPTGYFRVGYAY
jgi:hypothetical protein